MSSNGSPQDFRGLVITRSTIESIGHDQKRCKPILVNGILKQRNVNLFSQLFCIGRTTCVPFGRLYCTMISVNSMMFVKVKSVYLSSQRTDLLREGILHPFLVF